MQPNINSMNVCKSLTFSDLALLLGIFFKIKKKKIDSLLFKSSTEWQGTFILWSEPNVNTHAGV